MHARRLFLYSALFSPWLLKASITQAETEFERYKREQQQGVQGLTNEWQVYQKNYLAAYQQYKQKLGKVWNNPELSSQKEWVEYTKQIWDIPIPNKSDVAFGKHAAIMPEAIPYRLIKLYSFIGDIVLDPFAGSGVSNNTSRL